MIGNHLHSGGKFIIFGEQCASIPKSTQVL